MNIMLNISGMDMVENDTVINTTDVQHIPPSNSVFQVQVEQCRIRYHADIYAKPEPPLMQHADASTEISLHVEADEEQASSFARSIFSLSGYDLSYGCSLPH